MFCNNAKGIVLTVKITKGRAQCVSYIWSDHLSQVQHCVHNIVLIHSKHAGKVLKHNIFVQVGCHYVILGNDIILGISIFIFLESFVSNLFIYVYNIDFHLFLKYFRKFNRLNADMGIVCWTIFMLLIQHSLQDITGKAPTAHLLLLKYRQVQVLHFYTICVSRVMEL